MSEIEQESYDPGLCCDQCGKPQWDDGSGLCSWRAGTEFGSCDGRQVRRVFTNCNVCGRVLRGGSEHRMGMCDDCAKN